MALVIIENSKAAVDPAHVERIDIHKRTLHFASGVEMRLSEEDFEAVFLAKREGN